MSNLIPTETPLSLQLLGSIPKKVYSWLESLGEDLSRPDGYGLLSWEFFPEGGRLVLDQTDFGAPPIEIRWDGEATAVQSIRGTDPRFAFIDYNLEWFAEIESRIYDQIEALQDKIAEKTSYEFPRVSKR